MGLLFVLGFWAIAGSLITLLGVLVFRSVAIWLTRATQEGRKKKSLVWAATLLPANSLFWAAIVFAAQAYVNTAALNRDIGIGDSWSCPLPNGYELLMIDVTDEGMVYDRGAQSISESIPGDLSAISGVRELQVSGPWLLGGADTDWFNHAGTENGSVDEYFLLDTRSGKRTFFRSKLDLSGAATAIGITPHLEPIETIYTRYRFPWLDYAACTLMILPPLMAALLLLRRIFQFRREQRDGLRSAPAVARQP